MEKRKRGDSGERISREDIKEERGEKGKRGEKRKGDGVFPPILISQFYLNIGHFSVKAIDL